MTENITWNTCWLVFLVLFHFHYKVSSQAGRWFPTTQFFECPQGYNHKSQKCFENIMTTGMLVTYLRWSEMSKNFFTWSTGTGCWEGLWSLLLWRCSRPVWTRSCAACCRWPCFGRGVGLDDPQRSLLTPNVVWFCGSVKLSRPSAENSIVSETSPPGILLFSECILQFISRWKTSYFDS